MIRSTQRGPRRPLATLAVSCLAFAGAAAAQQPVQAPQPTVPEVFTLMGQYVRVAYNNAGFATLGYRVAQNSVGEEWLMLEVGLTVRTGKDLKLTREDLAIKVPDGTVIPLATQKEYGAANLRALNQRAKIQRDSINYFPADVSRGCAIQFFANLDQRPAISFDEVELSKERGCVGRLYFKVPGGIKVGQHWLIVHFGQDELQVPFRILTKDEAKQFEKSWEDIKDAHEANLKKQQQD